MNLVLRAHSCAAIIRASVLSFNQAFCSHWWDFLLSSNSSFCQWYMVYWQPTIISVPVSWSLCLSGQPSKATCVVLVFALSLSCVTLPGRSSLQAPTFDPRTWEQSHTCSSSSCFPGCYLRWQLSVSRCLTVVQRNLGLIMVSNDMWDIQVFVDVLYIWYIVFWHFYPSSPNHFPSFFFNHLATLKLKSHPNVFVW